MLDVKVWGITTARFVDARDLLPRLWDQNFTTNPRNFSTGRRCDLTNASQEFQVTPGSCNFRHTAKTTFESPSQPRNAVIRDRVKNFYGRSIWREDLHFLTFAYLLPRFWFIIFSSPFQTKNERQFQLLKTVSSFIRVTRCYEFYWKFYESMGFRLIEKFGNKLADGYY